MGESDKAEEEVQINFTFKKSTLDTLTRETYKFFDKEKSDEIELRRKETQRNCDRKRDKTEERRKMHNQIDKVRDKVREQTEKRKKMHNRIDKVRDKVRDQTEERKEMHRRINRLRDKKEERKQYKQDLHTRNFLKSVDSDTGFNVICACCSEYKSRYTCTGIQVLTVSQQRKFLINKKLVISKDGQRYICKVCRIHIKKGKIPTKSEKQQWKYANIPTHLKKTLTKVTSYSKVIKKRKLSKEVNNIDRALELNKLEAHLLKLIIPFVRIAHCPRGTYFKVRGNLILISADVTHSLSRILPLSQNIIPVCFKRKLEYTGNYLEEVIDKNKVQAYFDFYKANNPLYKITPNNTIFWLLFT